MSNKVQAALELRKALQYFIATFDADNEADITKILSIPTMYPKYKVGKTYLTKEIFSYGENSAGDPQLYQVLQDHIAMDIWTPDTATSLYKKVGVSEDGYAEWVQPLGASDAYNTGDIVIHNGVVYKSTVDANTWEPGVYGWEEV